MYLKFCKNSKLQTYPINEQIGQCVFWGTATVILDQTLVLPGYKKSWWRIDFSRLLDGSTTLLSFVLNGKSRTGLIRRVATDFLCGLYYCSLELREHSFVYFHPDFITGIMKRASILLTIMQSTDSLR